MGVDDHSSFGADNYVSECLAFGTDRGEDCRSLASELVLGRLDPICLWNDTARVVFVVNTKETRGDVGAAKIVRKCGDEFNFSDRNCGLDPTGDSGRVVSKRIVGNVPGDNLGLILAVHKIQEKIGEMGRSGSCRGLPHVYRFADDFCSLTIAFF